jgi:hypothetical protein
VYTSLGLPEETKIELRTFLPITTGYLTAAITDSSRDHAYTINSKRRPFVQRCESIDRGIEDREESGTTVEKTAEPSERSRKQRYKKYILNRSVASASDIMPLDTT